MESPDQKKINLKCKRHEPGPHLAFGDAPSLFSRPELCDMTLYIGQMTLKKTQKSFYLRQAEVHEKSNQAIMKLCHECGNTVLFSMQNKCKMTS